MCTSHCPFRRPSACGHRTHLAGLVHVGDLFRDALVLDLHVLWQERRRGATDENMAAGGRSQESGNIVPS